MESDSIVRIVLTGGPCAGKSTVFEKLDKYLTEQGYYVITVPETATELIKRKIFPNSSNREDILMFQDFVLQQQYIKECIAETYAKKISETKKVIILYDRAIMDNRAYLQSQDDFDNLLSKYNLNELELLHKYDLVIDLVSTATCKPELYKLDGVRSESVSEAAALDKKTTTAWIHHPNIKLVKPTDNVKEKVDIVKNIVNNYLNHNEYKNKETLMLNNDSNLSIYNDDNSKKINIYSLYLDNDLVVIRKQYRNNVMFMYGKYTNSYSQKMINEQEFINLIYNHKLLFTEQKSEINFTSDGNIYKIVDIDNNLYLEKERNSELENVSNLSFVFNESLVKRKKYDII